MSMQMIEAGRLKTIRKARKIGRPKLAKLSGLSERQLGKLETAKVAAGLSLSEVERLAHVLDVPVPTLTGDLPMSDDDLQPASQGKCTSGCCG